MLWPCSGHLLKSCKSLIKFVARETDVSLGPEIIEALEPACSGLEALGLGFVGEYNGPRISTFRHFAALTLYLGMHGVRNRQVAQEMNSPPHPGMLLTALLPESIEEVAVFSEHIDAFSEFDFEAHVRRLAVEITAKGRFQHLRWLHGVSFTPIDGDLEDDVEQAVDQDDPDQAQEIEDNVARRFATLDEARELMSDGGVEFTFDLDKERNSYFDIDYLAWGPDI